MALRQRELKDKFAVPIPKKMALNGDFSLGMSSKTTVVDAKKAFSRVDRRRMLASKDENGEPVSVSTPK